MSSKEKQKQEKKRLMNAIFIPFIFCMFLVLVYVFEHGMGLDFHKAGILPRSFKYISGILTYVFIHASIGHLVSNVIPMFVLSSCLFYFYRPIAVRVFLILYISSGVLLWCIGRENWHIGASGLIYAIAFFLFFSGVIRKHIPLIAISLVVAFMYGSMVWHVFPWKINDPISWEGHLSGAFSGFVLAIIFRRSGPQRPEPEFEDEEGPDENEDDSDGEIKYWMQDAD